MSMSIFRLRFLDSGHARTTHFHLFHPVALQVTCRKKKGGTDLAVTRVM